MNDWFSGFGASFSFNPLKSFPLPSSLCTTKFGVMGGGGILPVLARTGRASDSGATWLLFISFRCFIVPLFFSCFCNFNTHLCYLKLSSCFHVTLQLSCVNRPAYNDGKKFVFLADQATKDLFEINRE